MASCGRRWRTSGSPAPGRRPRPPCYARRWRARPTTPAGSAPAPTGSRRPWSRRAGRGSRGCSRRSGGGSGMGTPAGRYRVEAMRETMRRYGSRTVGALRSLTTRARLLGEWLGTRVAAVVRGWWRDRERLLDQGDAWVRRHKVAVSVAFVAIAIVWLISLIVFSLPDRVLSWRFWTRRPEDVRNLSLVVIGFLGIGAGIAGLVFGAIRAHAAHVQARVAEQGHITDRFTKAVEQLGSDKLEVRLGGIYALERVARDSRRDHGPIMETLTAFVRENAPWPPRESAEGLEGLLAEAIPANGRPGDEPPNED